jgi:hypothetical protein
MPEGGFRWIASSSAVLRVWLALLEEDTRSARTLGAILTRAKSLAILQHFIQLAPSCNPASFPTSPERSTTFTEPPAMTQAELEKNLAIDFLAWVQASLAAGNLIINKHPLFTIAGGLLLGPALFDLYVLKNPFGVKNGKAVQHALLGLQLHQIEANNNILSRTKQKAGIVLREFAMVLPDRFQIESKGTISTFRATDFVYHAAFSQKEPCTLENLPHIHANGEWVHPTSSGVKTSIFFAAHSHG